MQADRRSSISNLVISQKNSHIRLASRYNTPWLESPRNAAFTKSGHHGYSLRLFILLISQSYSGSSICYNLQPVALSRLRRQEFKS
jgi:hypothetical protein